MKTISIVFLAIVATVVILIGIGSVSGHFSIDNGFGIKDKNIPINNIMLPEGMTVTIDDFGDRLPEVSQETTTQVIKAPSGVVSKNPYLEHAEIDFDKLVIVCNPPSVYLPDDIFVLDGYEMPIIDPDVMSGDYEMPIIDPDAVSYYLLK